MLLGAAAMVPELWPSDVEQGPFLQRAVDLTADVAGAAVAVLRLRASKRPAEQAKAAVQPREASLLRAGAVLTPDDLLPDVNTAAPVITAAEEYYKVVRSMVVIPGNAGSPSSITRWPTAVAIPRLNAVMSTYDLGRVYGRSLRTHGAREVETVQVGTVHDGLDDLAPRFWASARSFR
jgi:hypothetical protein